MNEYMVIFLINYQRKNYLKFGVNHLLLKLTLGNSFVQVKCNLMVLYLNFLSTQNHPTIATTIDVHSSALTGAAIFFHC